MYSILHGLLHDKTGGEIFTLFSGWHFLYIILTVVGIALALVLVKGKSENVKKTLERVLISVAFGMYIADFFLMPFAYGRIDIEKLPFHACTSMCVMCFLSHHIKFLESFRHSFVLLGFISNLVYLIYPAGVMWYAVHPTSYRVIQTLLFHSLMTVYGFIVLALERDKFNIRKCYRDLAVIAALTVWALIGSYAYSGNVGDYNYSFNWFFVVHDPLNVIPVDIAPYVAPFINIAVFFGAEILIHLILIGVKKINKKAVDKSSADVIK